MEYEHIADFFDNSLNTLLDIGCGTGLELKAIYNRFPDVKITGIDLSRDMLRRLKEKYTTKDIRTIEADYFDYPFENEQYDAALSFESLHHFKYEKKLPHDLFVHIDISLTLQHQIELMKNAGFKAVNVLYQNCGTVSYYKGKKIEECKCAFFCLVYSIGYLKIIRNIRCLLLN